MKEKKEIVDRCICFNKTFEQIKKMADDRCYVNTKQVVLGTRCGTKCGLCIPYIRDMMKTGEVRG